MKAADWNGTEQERKSRRKLRRSKLFKGKKYTATHMYIYIYICVCVCITKEKGKTGFKK
jgi:hypothetical protein